MIGNDVGGAVICTLEDRWGRMRRLKLEWLDHSTHRQAENTHLESSDDRNIIRHWSVKYTKSEYLGPFLAKS